MLINETDKAKISMHKIEISGGHSFPRNAEFWGEPRILPISTEFLRFCGISRNSVLAAD